MSRAAIIAATAAVVAGVGAVSAVADHDDHLADARIVFARDHSLWRTDGNGKAEAEEVAALPSELAATDVRSLATDPGGRALLADLAGTWHWMPLDGSTTALTALTCKGAARLAPDGACVICANDKGEVRIAQLANGKTFDVAVPADGAVIVGDGADRKLMWSDGGVWSAPFKAIDNKQAVAPESPLRSLSIAPDGSRAVGVYAGEIFTGKKTKQPADVLFQFALDGTAARRKSIRNGVPLAWSHDSQWVLIQDGGSACIARGVGGEYKCWKGYTGVSLAPDGSYALLLGARKGGKDHAATKHGTDDTDGGEGGDAGDDDDATATPAPTGPLSLYRGTLAGAFTDPPAVIEKLVDGAAVWLP